MDKEIVRAYLWQDIIRLGFSPSGTKNQKSWLFQYGKSLKSFWEVENYPYPPYQIGDSLAATIDSSRSLGLTFEYAIEDAQKFTVRMMYAPPRKDHELMWMHDMDGQYFSLPIQNFLTNCHSRNQAVLKMNLNDIAKVVDSLIMHPLPHQHIESPLDNHDIRVGGGLLNPFLYLFHLRVQLCPDEARRVAEKERLVSIFDIAIRGNSQVTAYELLEIPE